MPESRAGRSAIVATTAKPRRVDHDGELGGHHLLDQAPVVEPLQRLGEEQEQRAAHAERR